MPLIDDTAILKRAKQLCDVDRMAWDRELLKATRKLGGHIKGVLDNAQRRHYLTTARSQLLNERDRSHFAESTAPAD